MITASSGPAAAHTGDIDDKAKNAATHFIA
jgi:hypothetical protein